MNLPWTWLSRSLLLLSLLPTSYSLKLDPPVALGGNPNSPIYNNSPLFIGWTKTSDSDPTTFEVDFWQSTDAIIPAIKNARLEDQAVQVNTNGLTPDTYQMVVFNNAGSAIATSPVFTILALPGQATSTPTVTKTPLTTFTQSSIPTTEPFTTTTNPSTNAQSSSADKTSSSNTAIIVFSSPSSTGTSIQPSSTNATTSPEQNSQNPGANTKKTPTGAIAGGVVGAVLLLTAIGILVLCLLRRRRRLSSTDNLELPEENVDVFAQPLQAGDKPLEKQGRLAAVIQEREEMQRQQDLLQADLLNQRGSHLQQYNGPTQREALLMQQNQLLAERIVALESQQREIEDRLGDDAPPDYATAYRPQSRVISRLF
jgi:hypothetical protein